MISDVLSDSIIEIENYQKTMPDVYGEMEDEINKVKETMRKLRIKLDTPPSDIINRHN